MTELTLKERKMKALQWTDNNLSEMKNFCGNNCTITYESCSVDDYWLLKVYDSIKERDVIVGIGDYVVEYDNNCFTVIDIADIKLWCHPFNEYEEPVATTSEKSSEDNLEEIATKCYNATMPINNWIDAFEAGYCAAKEAEKCCISKEEADKLWKRALMDDLRDEKKYE